MIFIDSDVFLIDLRYRTDARFKKNSVFLKEVHASGKGVTTIYNLLEVCGILSFNLNVQQLREFYYYFPYRYNVEILPGASERINLPTLSVSQIFEMITRKSALGDAMIMALLMEDYAREIVSLVSWNVAHFAGRIPIPAYTPEETKV